MLPNRETAHDGDDEVSISPETRYAEEGEDHALAADEAKAPEVPATSYRTCTRASMRRSLLTLPPTMSAGMTRLSTLRVCQLLVERQGGERGRTG